jgi:plastocyanin
VLSTNGAGVLSWVAQTSGGTYTLPTATGSVLGGIKIGTGLSIDGNGVVSAAGGATAFTGLSDVGSAGLTVDKIYLPAITRLNITTPVFNYNIDQYSGDNPAIYAISGTTIAFNLQQSSSHPFLLQQNNANITTANLIHVSTSGVVSTGSSAQAKYEGTLYWKIPSSVSGTFRYICSVHTSMVGSITIKDISTI